MSNLTLMDAFKSIGEAARDYVNSKLQQKTEKVQINYLGEKQFKVGGSGPELTYAQIHDYLMDSPNFVLMVHGNREHRCTMIDDSSNPRSMRFVAPILSDGVLKTQSIYVTSLDGEAITSVSVTNINSENQSNKAQVITDANKGSTAYYTSIKAVADYVDSVADSKQDTLTAGENITIVDNVISASGGGDLGLVVVDGMLCVKYEEAD